MNTEECRNETKYLKIYDRLVSSVGGNNPEETLGLANIAYCYVFDKYKKESNNTEKEELKKVLNRLSETIDGRVVRLELSHAFNELIGLLRSSN